MQDHHQPGRPAADPTPPTDRNGLRGGALPESPEAVGYELRVLEALRRIIRAVDRYSRKLVAQHQITGPQLVCLLTILNDEPTTATRLANQVHLSPSTVIGILDRLEAKDLIRRERDRKDRRVVHLSLTSRGRVLIESAPSPLQETLAVGMLRLPEGEQAAIVEALERIVDMMEARDIDAAPILETGPINRQTGS